MYTIELKVTDEVTGEEFSQNTGMQDFAAFRVILDRLAPEIRRHFEYLSENK